MKLSKVLDNLGSLEKNSFIKVIDNIISNSPKNSREIDKILSSADKGLKSVDNQNIAKIFDLVKFEFHDYLKEVFQDTSSQLDILIDIIIRDGNCLMKQDWFSRLYENEIKNLKKKIKKLDFDLKDDKSNLPDMRKRDYLIYKACLTTAYKNDLVNNRESKVTNDELTILVTLANELGLSQEEVKLINYSILPIKKNEIQDVINSLKNIGVLFFSKKDNDIYVTDEMVRLLRKLREKIVADKFIRRILKLLNTSTINQISRIHNINHKLSNQEKIEEIIKEGVNFRSLLNNDMHKEGTTLTVRKKTLNDLCEKGLSISNLKGSTLEDKIQSLIDYFDAVENDINLGISHDGFGKMLAELDSSLPKLNKQIKAQFEFQNDFVLNASLLINYNIKPRDILDLLSKESLMKFIKDNGIKQRGDDITNILDHYKDSENLYLENFENVAYRNLNKLKENGIIIKESELGLKFEELTKVIFTKLGFKIDDKLKSSLNTSKDKMDILINLENADIIIIECKTVKEKGYNKYSSVSRQLKSYQKLVQDNNIRIAKVLLVAPEFSDDFISDCEMSTDMNLSLVTASSLFNILNEFKVSKYTIFPHVLFRDVLLNEERIIKALRKK